MKIEEIESRVREIASYMITNSSKIAGVIADRSTESALKDIEETLERMVKSRS